MLCLNGPLVSSPTQHTCRHCQHLINMSLTYTTSNTFQTFVPPQVIDDFPKSKKVCWQASRSEAFCCNVGSSAAELLKHCAKHTHLIPGGPWKKNMFQCWLHPGLWKAYLIAFTIENIQIYTVNSFCIDCLQAILNMRSDFVENVTSTPTGTKHQGSEPVETVKLSGCYETIIFFQT